MSCSSLWYPTLAVRYYFFTENVSILMSFVKEDADVDYISLDLHLIKSTLISVWNIIVCIFGLKISHPSFVRSSLMSDVSNLACEYTRCFVTNFEILDDLNDMMSLKLFDMKDLW